jgi:hypothetical protein
MANAFDDLLGNLVNRLKGIGVGSGTAAENRAKIDYQTASNRAAQAGQATPSEYPYYYGSGADPATAYSNNVGTLNRQAPTGMGGYNQGGMFKFAEQQSVNDTIAGAVPESLSPWRENQLRIEERIRQEEEAARPKNRGLGTSTEEAGYEANLEKARRERARLLEGNVSLERQENEERRMIDLAASEQERRGLFDYGGNDMASREQLQIDPIVLEVGDKPTNAEIVKTLEEDYANLAASGADSATLSELAREIDSYRDKEVSLPSIVSEAAASDVVELNGASLLDQEDTYSPFGSPRLSPALMESIIEGEGDTLINDPNDIGGATKFGIAYNYNKNELKKYGINSPNEMDKLTEDQANELYTSKYYNPSKAKQLPFEARKAYLNSYINSPTKGVKALQTTVGAVVDGKFGKGTEAKIQEYLKNNSSEDLGVAIQKNYITQLIAASGKNTWSGHGNGWVNRYLGLKDYPFGKNKINLNTLKTEDEVFDAIKKETGIDLRNGNQPINTSTSFVFDPTPENQKEISTPDRPYPQTQTMTHRQQNLDWNQRDQFQFMSREGRDGRILEDNDQTYEQYVAAVRRRQGRK